MFVSMKVSVLIIVGKQKPSMGTQLRDAGRPSEVLMMNMSFHSPDGYSWLIEVRPFVQTFRVWS